MLLESPVYPLTSGRLPPPGRLARGGWLGGENGPDAAGAGRWRRRRREGRAAGLLHAAGPRPSRVHAAAARPVWTSARLGAYPGGCRLGHGCLRPSLSGLLNLGRPVESGAVRWQRRRRSEAAQPRSSCPAAASCVRATCPTCPLNKSCARGRALGRAQRPLQPEGLHSCGLPLPWPRGPPESTSGAGAASWATVGPR